MRSGSKFLPEGGGEKEKILTNDHRSPFCLGEKTFSRLIDGREKEKNQAVSVMQSARGRGRVPSVCSLAGFRERCPVLTQVAWSGEGGGERNPVAELLIGKEKNL